MSKIKSPGAVAAHGASETDQLGGKVVPKANRQQQFTQAPIHATLIGSDRCEALGVSARGFAPVLELCRALIELGVDPSTPLHAYRCGILCLRVSDIGWGAQFTVENDRHGRPRLRCWRERDRGCGAASSIAPNGRVSRNTTSWRKTTGEDGPHPLRPWNVAVATTTISFRR